MQRDFRTASLTKPATTTSRRKTARSISTTMMTNHTESFLVLDTAATEHMWFRPENQKEGDKGSQQIATASSNSSFNTLANAIIRLPAKPRLPLPSSPRSRNWTLDPNSSARFSFPPGFLSPLHQLPGPFHLRFFPPRFPDHSTFSRFRFTVFGVFSTTLHTDSWGGV